MTEKEKSYDNNDLSDVLRLPDIPVEEFFEDVPGGVIVLGYDPYSDKTIAELEEVAANIQTTQELVDLYAGVFNKFWYIEDERYDYEEDTEEYEQICAKVDACGVLMDRLEERVIAEARKQGVYDEIGGIRGLEPFMDSYGYWNGGGWWVGKDKMS